MTTQSSLGTALSVDFTRLFVVCVVPLGLLAIIGGGIRLSRYLKRKSREEG